MSKVPLGSGICPMTDVAAFLMELESNPNFRSNPGSPVSRSLIQDLGGRIRAIYLISVFSHNNNDSLK